MNLLRRLLRRGQPRLRQAILPGGRKQQPPSLIMAEAVIPEIAAMLRRQRVKRHEGVAYLLGRTDGHVTVVVASIRPDARTTPGSFRVSSLAMARVVRAAADRHLQVVGQVHTHPERAYHSAGDIAGARIRHQGYVSLVLPGYGSALPSLRGSAIYFYDSEEGFVELTADEVQVVPGRIG
jgi:proteasome lid subunit RPN8/RPN11